MNQDLSTAHIAELIEEAIYHRVEKTISDYVNKNDQAFAVNKIAGVEWNLQLTVLVDNLGLNPQPKLSIFKRLINAIKNFLQTVRRGLGY